MSLICCYMSLGYIIVCLVTCIILLGLVSSVIHLCLITCVYACVWLVTNFLCTLIFAYGRVYNDVIVFVMH